MIFRVVVTLFAAAWLAGCSSTQYSNNGIGSFIPYDSNPSYSNIVVADTPYVPKRVVSTQGPLPTARPTSTVVAPAAHIAQAETTPNVVVATINGDVIPDLQGTSPVPEHDYQAANGVASYQMRPGLLKPQVVALLLNHPNIKDPSGVIWKARDNLTWPNNFRVSETEIDVVLNEILKPYKLYADFKKNNAVIITGGI